ncbi:MAG: hypothetical protein M1488_03675 [Gammaproteobacteria bacterium]|nr:hypothetical protein [Gammaproteobacteria bacterium]
MTAAEIIEDVLAAGGEIWTEGDRLKFRDAPARLVPAIREHKAALLALLKAPDDYDRQERAAIMEYDGGLPREKAERLAGLAPPPLTITRRDPNARFRETPQPAPATVTCGTCAEFEPGTPAWGRGIGRCSRTANGLPPVASRGYGACFPDAPRTCPDYKEL